MTVDEFVETKVLPQFREVVTAIRQLMRQAAPQATEEIAYGIPVFKVRRIIAVISPTKKDISFSFSRGADFEDKYGLLQGVGKVSKLVKIRRVDEMNIEALKYYIQQALEFEAK